MTTTTAQATKVALFKRQGTPVEQIEESVAEHDERLTKRFPGCLDDAIAVRERFRPNGERIMRDNNGKVPSEGQLVVTIVKQAIIEVEGQRTMVEDLEDVRSEARLREVATYLTRSWAAQARIDWLVENWVAIIRFIKRDGPKGGPEEVLARLLAGEEEWSPVLLLSWEFAKREALGLFETPDYLRPDLRRQIEQAVEEGERAVERTNTILRLLQQGQPEPLRIHVPGF